MISLGWLLNFFKEKSDQNFKIKRSKLSIFQTGAWNKVHNYG